MDLPFVNVRYHRDQPMTQCTVSNSLTAEQREAIKPWAIAFVATWIVEFASLTGGIIFMLLRPEFTQRAGSGILAIVCVKRVVTDICSRQMSLINGDQPTYAPNFWLSVTFAILSLGYFVYSVWTNSNFGN